MIRKTLPYILLFFYSLSLQSSFAQNNRWWEDLGNQSGLLPRSESFEIPTHQARFLEVDISQFFQLLNQVERNTLQDKYTLLEIPNAEGNTTSFLVKEESIMESVLQEKYPQIRTYRGYDLNQANRWIRIDRNKQNWHAIIMDHSSSYYIDPINRKEKQIYQVYKKEDCISGELPQCNHHPKTSTSLSLRNKQNIGAISQIRKNYRIAISATYNYTNFHGGTKEQALAAITTTLNRVNMVYERDLGVFMTLIGNNDTLIIDDPDLNIFRSPFSEGDENQGFIDDRIGNENYDIGHVLGVGSNAYANLGVVCDNFSKAEGFTSIPAPIGDPFDIDFVAHEIGHQFGANHTFNGRNGSCGPNRYFGRAFEPGSGSTIMAYAGLCDTDDFTPQSGDYFHGGSITEMNEFITTGIGATCPQIDTITNSAPEIDMPFGGLHIPILTPFELEASAFDQEEDQLSYCWEQIDLGNAANLGSYIPGNIPLFRSFTPQSSSLRSFPRLSDLLENRFLDTELLPNQSRELNFQLTVRDNNPEGPALSWEEVKYFVDGNSGPFRVTNLAELYSGAFQKISWEVANTNQAPVNADSVEIYLSSNGGEEFDILLSTVPNIGNSIIFLPEVPFTEMGRIKIKAQDNIFFDINDRNIPVYPITDAPLGLELLVNTDQVVYCNQEQISIPLFYNILGNPDSIQFSFEAQVNGFQDISLQKREGKQELTLVLNEANLLSSGFYQTNIKMEGPGIADSVSFEVQLINEDASIDLQLIHPAPEEEAISIRPTFTWLDDPLANDYTLQIAFDSLFETIIYESNPIQDTFLNTGLTLETEREYFWRVDAVNNLCGTRSFSATQKFTTEAIICQTYRPNDLPISFNALPFIQSSIDIEDDLEIKDVNIRNIEGSYPIPGNLRFIIRSPEGPILELLPKQNNCQRGDAFDFSVDDLGTTFVPCPNDRAFNLKPSDPLSTYNGQSTLGRWALSVFDDGQDGQLSNWELEVCFGSNNLTTSTKEIPIRGFEDLRVFPNPMDTEINFSLEKGLISQLLITDALGKTLYRAQNLNHKTLNLTNDNWPKGIYFYQVLDQEKQVYTGKIIHQ